MAIINRYVHKPWHKPCHKPSPKFEVYWIGPPQWDDENPTPHLWPVGWDGLLLGLQKRNWTWEYITISELCIYIFFSHEALSCCHVYLYICILIYTCILYIYTVYIYIYVYYTYFNRIVFPLPPTCPWWTPFEPLIPWPTEHRNDGHQRRAWAEANEAPAQAEAAGTSKVRWKWWFTGDLPIENGDFP
jgi:hypothetical protein